MESWKRFCCESASTFHNFFIIWAVKTFHLKSPYQIYFYNDSRNSGAPVGLKLWSWALTICQNKPVGMSKSANHRMRWRLPFSIRFLVIVFGWSWETGHWKIYQMVRKFPPFRSERKKRTTSEGSVQFPNGFSGKLLFHLTFNRNFRIFLLNGKHPVTPVNL